MLGIVLISSFLGGALVAAQKKAPPCFGVTVDSEWQVMKGEFLLEREATVALTETPVFKVKSAGFEWPA